MVSMNLIKLIIGPKGLVAPGENKAATIAADFEANLHSHVADILRRALSTASHILEVNKRLEA